MARAQPPRRGGKAAGLGDRDEGLAQVPVHRFPTTPSSRCSFLVDHLFNIERLERAVQPYNGRQQAQVSGSARPGALKSTSMDALGDETGLARQRRNRMPLPASLADSLELPVVGSPLFIVSGPELVIAQCKAGIVGSFPALNARPVEKLDEWLTRIENELGEYKALHPEKKVAPYAVNQICHASNDRLMKDMETCVKHKVPIIITSLRPPSEIVEAAHSY